MSGAPTTKPQSERELKTTRTLNTIATIGAGHALYSMTPEKKREAARERLLKLTPEKTRPGARKILATLKQPELGGKLTTAGKVVAGGWLGLHSAELAGDIMARRSINNQLAQVQARKNKGSVDSVKKNDQSMISKSEGYVSRNGHGKSLVDKAFSSKENTRETVLVPGYGYVNGSIRRRPATKNEKTTGGFSGGAVGGIMGGLVATSHPRPTNKVLAIGAGSGALAGAGLGYAGSRHTREFYPDMRKHSGAKHRPGKYVTASEQAEAIRNTNYMAARQRQQERVGKAYRRFDPEADRQRRLGLYAGTGVGGSILAGGMAAPNFSTKLAVKASGKEAKDIVHRGIFAKPGKGKKGLGLAAISAASGAAGIGSYKRGLSQRNQPWT